MYLKAESKVWGLRELGPHFHWGSSGISPHFIATPSITDLLTFSSVNREALIGLCISCIYNFTHLMSCFNRVCARIKVSFLNSMLSSQWILGMEKREEGMCALLALTVTIFHAPHILEMAERISFHLLKAPFRPIHLHFWVTFQNIPYLNAY